jgi:hypothetical protein
VGDCLEICVYEEWKGFFCNFGLEMEFLMCFLRLNVNIDLKMLESWNFRFKSVEKLKFKAGQQKSWHFENVIVSPWKTGHTDFIFAHYRPSFVCRFR